MRFCTTYETEGDADSLARALEQCASGENLVSRAVHRMDGTIDILMIQQAPWYMVLLQARLQKIHWVIRHDRGQTRLTYKASLYGWYWGCIAATTAVWTALLVAFFDSTTRLGVFLVLPFAVLLFLGTWLLTAQGGHRIDRMLTAAQKEIGPLHHMKGISRGVFSLLCYLAYFIIVATWILGGKAFEPSPTRTYLLVAFFLLALIFFSGGIPLSACRFGFSSRENLLIQGTLTCLAVVLLLAPVGIMGSYAIDRGDLVSALRERAAILQHQPAGIYPRDRAIWQDTLDTFNKACAFYASMFGTLLMLSAGVTLWSVFMSGELEAPVTRLRRSQDDRTARAAVTGEGFLSLFRAMAIGFWYSMALFIGCAMALLLFPWMNAVCGTSLDGPLGIGREVEVMILVVAGAFRENPQNAWPQLVVRVGWGLYGGVCFGLLVASIGGLLIEEERTHARLRRNRPASASDKTGVKSIVERLAIRAGIRMPSVSISPSTQVSVQALLPCFCLRPYVEVSRGAIDKIGTGTRLEALLAHEIAHIKRRHVWKFRRMRLLGRVTFVGDTFTCAIQNSIRYELEADDLAADLIGEKEPLRDALRILRLVVPLQFRRFGVAPDGLGGAESCQPRQGEAARSWRARWQVFLWLYRRPLETAYWYPHLEERILRL